MYKSFYILSIVLLRYTLVYNRGFSSGAAKVLFDAITLCVFQTEQFQPKLKGNKMFPATVSPHHFLTNFLTSSLNSVTTRFHVSFIHPPLPSVALLISI